MEVLAIIALVSVWVAHNKINDLRKELRRAKQDGFGGDDHMYDELDRMRLEITELQERLDFTERMLVSHREKNELPAGD